MATNDLFDLDGSLGSSREATSISAVVSEESVDSRGACSNYSGLYRLGHRVAVVCYCRRGNIGDLSVQQPSQLIFIGPLLMGLCRVANGLIGAVSSPDRSG